MILVITNHYMQIYLQEDKSTVKVDFFDAFYFERKNKNNFLNGLCIREEWDYLWTIWI